MSFVSMINKVREGNWAGAAMDAATTAISAIPGVGTAASVGLNVANSAIQTAMEGGTAGDVAKNAGITAATAGVGSGVNSLLSTGVNNITGAATDITNAAANTATDITSAAQSATPSVVNSTTSSAATNAAANTAATTTAASNAGVSGVLPKLGASTTNTAATTAATNTATSGTVTGVTPSISVGTRVKDTLKSRVGQIGVQGVLSAASTVAGILQAKNSNDVAKQSLLFQQYTYNEAQAEKERTKASLKSDAYNAYTSANAFGESLYGTGLSSTLLTDYSSSNTGNYSILNNSTVSGRRSENT